jgi:predicted DNA binding protein
VELPASVRVREFVAAMREEFPDMSVVARRPPREDSGDAEAAPMNRLTDRQREVLTVAYHSGFFEWPRASTGEEVADRIGVAPPTFHKHVRTAERKLLAALLDRPEPRG